MKKIFIFIKFYIISMRLHFGFITGIAAWVGIELYRFNISPQINYTKASIVLISIFMAYGINQVINDYFGIKEDKINAPRRPMITGELNSSWALIISIILMLLLGVLGIILNPWCLIPVIIGGALNILYEYAKAWSLIGNLIFGLSIATTTVFGFLAMGPVTFTDFIIAKGPIYFLLITLSNFVMTYFTYFKDYLGDKKAGKNTFIVKYGLNTAKYTGLFLVTLPIFVLLIFKSMNILPSNNINLPFRFTAIMTLLIHLWTGIQFFRFPSGKATYFNLRANIRGCVAFQVAMIALINPEISLYLFIITYVFIGFIFDRHSDTQA